MVWQQQLSRVGSAYEGLEVTEVAVITRGTGDEIGSAAEDADQPTAPRRRGWAVAIAVASGLLALGAYSVFGRGGLPDPVRPEVTYVTGPTSVGQPATLGGLLLEYPQHADIEIVSVEPNLSENVEVIDTLAVFPVPVGYSGGVDGANFPPQHAGEQVDYRPALEQTFRAAQVGPDDEAGVVALHVGVRATSGELGGLNGVSVRYRVDGQLQTRYFPHALVLCLQQDRCDDDGEEALRSMGLLPDDPSA